MRASPLRCHFGFHTPPDPATPRPLQWYEAHSFDCGYPPYAWKCRVCRSYYGRHPHRPPFHTDRIGELSIASTDGALSIVDGGELSVCAEGA